MTCERTSAGCRCGKVEIQIVGAVERICLRELPGGRTPVSGARGVDSVPTEDGGTDYVATSLPHHPPTQSRSGYVMIPLDSHASPNDAQNLL